MGDTKITKPDGRVVEVKNLGWLRRHWRHVKLFRLDRLRPDVGRQGRMIAECDDGTVFETLWCSSELMLEWLDRPVFRGLPVILTCAYERLGPVEVKAGDSIDDDVQSILRQRREVRPYATQTES